MIYRLRISRSFGGECPMELLSVRAFSTKELALAAAMRSFPCDVALNWTRGGENDVKFDFITDSQRFQFWIDAFPVDEPIFSFKQDFRITQQPTWHESKGFDFDE